MNDGQKVDKYKTTPLIISAAGRSGGGGGYEGIANTIGRRHDHLALMA